MSVKKMKCQAKNEVQKKKLNLPYKFTPDELRELGSNLATAQIDLRELDDHRKMVADEWQGKISSKEAEISSLANKIRSGLEYRDIPCEITLDVPPGKKTCVRTDTGEVVWVRDLEPHELERELPLAEEGEGENDSN